MNNNSIKQLVSCAWNNLVMTDPNHEPFNGHLKSDPDTKSRFDFFNGSITLLHELLNRACFVSVKEGHDKVNFIFNLNDDVGCGETVMVLPRLLDMYVVVWDSPMPKFVKLAMNDQYTTSNGDDDGDGEIIVRHRTNEFTICLAWADVPGIGRDFVLSSVYPGRPVEPNISDLANGDFLIGREMIQRNIFLNM